MEAFLGFIVGVLILFPLLHVLFSRRSHGGATLGWFIAVLLFSWVAWVVFLIVTQPEADSYRAS